MIIRNALLSVGVVAVSLVLLYPRVTEAEEVSDEDRGGEYDEDGNRFGDILVKGELVAASGAPGGWSLVRTAENKSDHAAEADLEERIIETDTMPASRTGGVETAVLTRHQKIKLGPHEKKVVGTTFSKELGEKMTVNAKLSVPLTVSYGLLARPYKQFRAEYLRELRAGETAMAPRRDRFAMPRNTMYPPNVVALEGRDRL